jgi:biotin carboxyl carrier protein
MLDALIREGDLMAPTVGTWRPRVAAGQSIRRGLVLGFLERAGRLLEVVAGAHVDGVVVAVVPAGSWVAYGERLVTMGEGTAGAATEERAADRASDLPDGVEVICADTDGTIYLRPAPDQPPFAQVGDQVAPQATVALIEVMKTFSPVRAPEGGELIRCAVTEGEAVEAGAPLWWIRPLP